MKIQSILTSKLNHKQINKIIELKDSHWNHGKKSQKNWFKNKLKRKDLHILLTKNNSLIGYTLLKERSFYYIQKKKIKKYLNFETLILKKKYRNFPILKKIMRFNNSIIKKNNKFSFLECKKDKIKMYNFFGWKLLDKKKFKLLDKESNKNIMVYNLKEKLSNKKKLFIFINK